MWFLVSFCLPFLGLACTILYRWDDRELRRECPQCGKLVKLYDAVCVRCGEEPEFRDVAIAPGRPLGDGSRARRADPGSPQPAFRLDVLSCGRPRVRKLAPRST
jgi:hypothetical protein